MIVVAMIASQAMVAPDRALAQSSPSTLPRLAFSDLSYAGAFRVPSETVNGENLKAGGQALAFSPGKPSLFITSLAGLVAEVSIPTPGLSKHPDDLPFATFLQGFADPVEGHMGQVAGDGVWTNSLVVHNGRLFGTASVYYDALNQQRVSHYHRALQLTQPSFSGFTQVWETAKTGFVAGNLALVPSEWQPALGGAMVSGQCCVPIVSRTSWGPAAFTFDPGSIGQKVAAATPLLYYTQDHPTVGQWGSTNEVYGDATGMGGLVIVSGTRTALFFGRNGLGPACYGAGTSDASIVGTIGADGAKWCYDPTNPYKGTHAYPYRYQIWAYDLNDLAAVKSGAKKPWEIVPYDVWPFDFPTTESRVWIGGVTYDAEHQTLYVTQQYADAELRPIIHVMKVGGTGESLSPSKPTPGQVGAVTLSADKSAPQAPGSTIAFTATAAAGSGPKQFKWLLFDGAAWSVAANWGPSSTFTWTPTVPGAHYQVRVWARSGSSSADQPEALATMPFPVQQSTAITVAGTSSPQLLGTALSFRATATGGTAPYQFKWRVFDGQSWSVRADWGESHTFNWTPPTARNDYRIEVAVRSAGNSSDVAEGSTSVPFVINAPQPPAAVKVTGVSLTADAVSPQPVGTTIRFTANAAGGGAPLQYKWSTFDGASWTPVTGWVGAATFNWKPGAAGTYQIAVAVKSAGNASDQAEASTTLSYTMNSAPVAVTPPAAVPFNSVTISASKESPQAVNTSITWVASASGGTGAAVYKWLVFDGVKWTTAVNWSSSPQFTWVPKIAGNHLVGVWVKRADNPNDAAEATRTTAYVIK
jgi:hypothetical protein